MSITIINFYLILQSLSGTLKCQSKISSLRRCLVHLLCSGHMSIIYKRRFVILHMFFFLSNQIIMVTYHVLALGWIPQHFVLTVYFPACNQIFFWKIGIRRHFGIAKWKHVWCIILKNFQKDYLRCHAKHVADKPIKRMQNLIFCFLKKKKPFWRS